ncbi:MAG: ATP-binding protein [Pseudohongiellaceae bacterium]
MSMSMPRAASKQQTIPLRSRALRITGIYAIVATLWIYFSDQVLFAVFPDAADFTRWSVVKGLAFVALTSLLLLWLMWRAFGAIEKSHAALRRSGSDLRELNVSLEKNVADRTRELEAALIRARAADALKSAFLATMSHELRTPLNSIIGFTGIIQQGLAGPINDEQRKQLGMVRNSARHLLDLINDVLDLSKIEAGELRLSLASFDVRETIERISGLVRPMADKKGLTLELQIDGALDTMHSDRRRIEQIILNLLGNAIKFTESGQITLIAEREPAFRKEADQEPVEALRLLIRDTGIGIRPDDMTGLFQPFNQVDSGLTRQHEGTGLGLAICRRMAERLGGTISVESEWKKGSEFSAILPLEWHETTGN